MAASLLQRLKQFRRYWRYLKSWCQPLPVIEYQGQLLDSELSLRLITVGSSQLITEALFRQPPQRQQLGNVNALLAQRYLTQLIQSGQHAAVDLIVQPALPWQATQPGDLLLPDYLEARLPFHGTYQDWLAQLRDNTRRSVQQARKLGVRFQRVSSIDDYAYFHQHLLTPYMQARHGYNCYVESLADFCADTRHAVLEFLLLDEQIVGGFHLKMPAHATASYFNKVGLSEASFKDKTRMRLLNSLIYARMAELSIAAGYAAMELGITPAILGHGILWYKAGWGAEFRANDTLQRYHLRFNSNQAAAIKTQLPALIEVDANARLQAQAWAKNEAELELRRTALEKYRFAGLQQIHLTALN